MASASSSPGRAGRGGRRRAAQGLHRPPARRLRAADPAGGGGARARRLRRRGAVHARHAGARTQRRQRRPDHGPARVARALEQDSLRLRLRAGSSRWQRATLAFRHLRRRYAVVQVYTMPDFLVFAGARPEAAREPRRRVHERADARAVRDALRNDTLTGVLERIEQAALRFADHSITVTEQLKQRYVERGATAEPHHRRPERPPTPPATWPAGRLRRDPRKTTSSS